MKIIEPHTFARGTYFVGVNESVSLWVIKDAIEYSRAIVEGKSYVVVAGGVLL